MCAKKMHRFVRHLLQPWSTMIADRWRPAIRAVSFGFGLSLSLLGFGWALFVPASELDHRSAASVLTNPSFRSSWTMGLERAGYCQAWGVHPVEGAPSEDDAPGECRGWYSPPGGSPGVWHAEKYVRTPVRIHEGSSRMDAVRHVASVPIRMAGKLILPFGILLVVQLGISAGYAKYKREQNADREEG